MFESGRFFTGANYWASHAGTAMWRDWRPQVVEGDLDRMAAAGLTVLRVFPLWPDFQPIAQLYGGGGTRMEIRRGEDVVEGAGPGAAGLDPEMLARFRFFADAAEKRGITLIVGLVTGWMSGRLFMPAALEGRDPLTDPLCLLWEVRFVRAFVAAFKAHKAIGAWDLGNECNCMGHANREQAWVWTASIAGAIRVEDPERPVVSGMHSLPVDPALPWNSHDQGELTDILTTHPYPRFTPHAGLDPVGSIRGSLHAAAETKLYGDLGGRTAFIEEAGTLGPAYGDQERAAAHLRTMLFSGWMENQRGLLWWCGFDQTHLAHAPYDWNAVERELGLLTVDGQVKPFAKEMASFQAFRKALPFDRLPPKREGAVCLLGPDQDQWGVAFGSYVLAAQAGLPIRFAWGGDELPDSPLYLMPSIGGGRGVPRRTWMAVLEKVERGAVLYLSLEDGIVAELERIAGVEIIHRSRRAGPISASFKQAGPEAALTCDTPVHMKLRATRGEVLALEPDGNPAVTRVAYGKGKVIFSALPLEIALTRKEGGFHGSAATPAWAFWKFLRDEASLPSVLVKREGRDVLLSEHPESERSVWAVLYSASEDPQTLVADVAAGWKAELVSGTTPGQKLAVQGKDLSLALAPWAAAVVRLTR